MKKLWFMVLFLSVLVVDVFATSGTSDSGGDTTIDTQKSQYSIGENIVVSFSNMSGDSEDWIGIYHAGAKTNWDNVVSWVWTGGKINGSVTLKGNV